jgi:hypothetical protein
MYMFEVRPASSIGRRAWLKPIGLAFGIIDGTKRLRRFRSRLLILLFLIGIAGAAKKK